LAPGGDQIFSVPITGGAVQDITAGSDPQISPNGRTLAFIAPDPQDPAGEAPYLVPNVGIDIASLSSPGSIRGIRALAPGPAELGQGASNISWSAGSDRLSFELLDPSTNVTTSWTVSVGQGVTSLASARQIRLSETGLTWNGYFGALVRGTPLGIGVLTQAPGKQIVVTINPLTGRTASRLFEMPAVVCLADAHPEQGCFSDFSNPVIADNAGNAVLVAGALPTVDVTQNRDVSPSEVLLYIWKVGEVRPLLIGHQVLVAAWAPS